MKEALNYGKEVEEELVSLEKFIPKKLPEKYKPRWISLKLLEEDEEIISLIKKRDDGEALIKKAEKSRKHLESVYGEDIETILADARYSIITGLVRESVQKPSVSRIKLSNKIDKVVTNKIIGIPIFLLLMWLMFEITFNVGAPLVDLVDESMGILGEQAAELIIASNGPEWLMSLIVDGVIGGVGSIIVFVPNIFILFFIIAILEDCGYMARAAFVMDRLMHKIGLHGKSFIPMLLGFGCNVPAIMATRTLRNKRDRLLTILINPFMSCSARLPVYLLFVGVFFQESQGTILFSLYLLGIIMAILSGLLFSRTLFKGLSAPFIMELPPYRIPTIKGALIHMWESGSLFIKKAGGIIFIAVILIWILASLPLGVEYASQESFIGTMGTAIAPVFAPAGFDSWQSSVSLLFGFVAKEVVVGTLGTLHGVEEEALGSAISESFTPLSAYAFMVFTLLYVPCMVAIATIKKETNSWKWPLFVAAYTTAIAWIMAVLVYQVGTLLGFA
jgi:ferrous iron transport protein B